MKIFISADIEGITGVTSWDETEKGKLGYQEAVRQMTAEVRAACEICSEEGHETVVRDAHDSAGNLWGEHLPRNVQLIRGWMNTPFSMMEGIDDSYDGAIYIGYHSPAATATSPLAHTMSFTKYQWISVNGILASEFSLNALIAASYHVPSIFLSGDRGICQLAKTMVPEIVTVETKNAHGNATWNKHPLDIVDQIKDGVRHALSKTIACLELEKEYILQIRFQQHQFAEYAAWYPSARRMDSHTVEYTARNPKEMLIAMMFMGGQ